MNVLLINGSPHEKGCTYTALSLIAGELNAAGIDTEILNVGTKPVGGCIGCGGCAAGKGCVFLGAWSTRPSKRPRLPTPSSSARRCTTLPPPAT